MNQILPQLFYSDAFSKPRSFFVFFGKLQLWMKCEAESRAVVSRSASYGGTKPADSNDAIRRKCNFHLYEVSIPTHSVLCLAPLHFRRILPSRSSLLLVASCNMIHATCSIEFHQMLHAPCALLHKLRTKVRSEIE